jgi:hypothetical protein
MFSPLDAIEVSHGSKCPVDGSGQRADEDFESQRLLLAGFLTDRAELQRPPLAIGKLCLTPLAFEHQLAPPGIGSIIVPRPCFVLG